MNEINVYKNRTNIVQVSLGYDVSQDTLTSEIRAGKDVTSDLIVAWDISFDTDGTDGELIFTIDDSASSQISANDGFMDIKRVTGGEPVVVFDGLITVRFKSPVTQ